MVGWFVRLQNLFGGAVSQNVAHTTALVAGLGAEVGTVLHDMTDLENQKFKVESQQPLHSLPMIRGEKMKMGNI